MADPFLSTRNSGYGGRGYVDPWAAEKTTYPSVTTVLKALGNEALIQWAVDNTAAYYAANPEAVFNKSVEGTYFMGRFYHKRVPDFDSPEFDPRNYHEGVLQDAADNGTWIHTFVEATLNDEFEPTPQNEQHEQMAEAFTLWMLDNDVTPVITERTVFGEGYAGTLDGIIHINGDLTLFDAKSSRAIHEPHRAQLAALGAAHTMAVPAEEGDKGAVSHTKTVEGRKETRWFKPEPLPPFTQYGVLQVRPDDVNSQGEFVPAFCAFHTISQPVIDASFEIFKGALQVKNAQRTIKQLLAEED